MKTYKIDLSNIIEVADNKNDDFYTETVHNEFLGLFGMIEIYAIENNQKVYFNDIDNLLDYYDYNSDVFYFKTSDIEKLKQSYNTIFENHITKLED